MKFCQKVKILLLVFTCFTLFRSNAQNLAVEMGHISEIIPKIQLNISEVMKNTASLHGLTQKLEKKAAEITKIVGPPPIPPVTKEMVLMVRPEQIDKLRSYEESIIDFLARSKRDTESKLVNTFIPVFEKIREYGFFLQDTIKSEYFKEKVEGAMEGIERAEPKFEGTDIAVEAEEEPEDEEVEEEEEEEEKEEEEEEEEEEFPAEVPETPVMKEEVPAPIAPPAVTPEPAPEEIPEEPLEEMPEEIEEKVEEEPEEAEEEPVELSLEEAGPMEEEEGGPTEEELKSILEERESDVVDVPMEAVI